MDWPRNILVFLAILGTKCSNHLVRCKITDVRLVGGPTPNKGTVELQQDNGTWETTCGVNLVINDVIPICRKLGFSGANRAILNTPYRQNSIPTKGLQCNDGVVELSECFVFTSPSCSTAGAASCHGKRYLGCFVDIGSDRVLPGDNVINDPSMTISKCIQFCNESTTAEYTYAGVGNGNECYCGEATDDYTRFGNVTNVNCHSPCPGDPTESCGGTGYIAVFTIHVETTPSTGSTASTTKATIPVSLSQKGLTSDVADVMTTSPMTTPWLTTKLRNQNGHDSCLGVGVGEGIVIILLIAIIIALVVYILRIRTKQRGSNHVQNTHGMTLVKTSSSNDKDSSFYHDVQASTLTPQGDVQYSSTVYGQKAVHATDMMNIKRKQIEVDADPYIEII